MTEATKINPEDGATFSCPTCGYLMDMHTRYQEGDIRDGNLSVIPLGSILLCFNCCEILQAVAVDPLAVALLSEEEFLRLHPVTQIALTNALAAHSELARKKTGTRFMEQPPSETEGAR